MTFHGTRNLGQRFRAAYILTLYARAVYRTPSPSMLLEVTR